MKKLITPAVVLVMLLGSVASAGTWSYSVYGNSDKTRWEDSHVSASASYNLGARSVSLSASGWENEDYGSQYGWATAWVKIVYVYTDDPSDPNDYPKGGNLVVELTSDHDTEVFGGIYGEGQGYVSSTADADSSIGGVSPSPSPETHVYGSDSLSGYGSAEAWFDPWEDPLVCWDEYTEEYEEERIDAYVAEMDGVYTKEVFNVIPQNVFCFVVQLTGYVAISTHGAYYEGEPTLFCEAEAELEASMDVDFVPYP